ncbi:Voltage-dependent T-type calcium channel subunit alpha-1I [Symbiodinium microadriaticum]|uniref:Voltage-dependent T-type calcium channel subunit alpha-1I n=1 Tax=Symbiodinium microadriaticum TaxID=2951 RepID=A0A1Q9DXY6_SYMMI|nr:Voltage-dependent T-type calcium channel subunit alpha-1I [Symbiodinium microadriaticum]
MESRSKSSQHLRLSILGLAESEDRIRQDLAAADPRKLAHCWIFQETLMDDLRECLLAYEQLILPGAIDWDLFNSAAANKSGEGLFFDRAWSVARWAAPSLQIRRHKPCDLLCRAEHFQDPAMTRIVRAADPFLFEKFGYVDDAAGAHKYTGSRRQQEDGLDALRQRKPCVEVSGKLHHLLLHLRQGYHQRASVSRRIMLLQAFKAFTRVRGRLMGSSPAEPSDMNKWLPNRFGFSAYFAQARMRGKAVTFVLLASMCCFIVGIVLFFWPVAPPVEPSAAPRSFFSRHGVAWAAPSKALRQLRLRGPQRQLGPGHLLQHSISPLSAMAFESRLRGTAALLEEAKRSDSRGLALLEELLVAVGKRDAPGLSEHERHRIAAEDVEPLLELLQEVVSASSQAAAALHHAARSQVEGGASDASAEEVKSLFQAADFVEQDAQLKLANLWSRSLLTISLEMSLVQPAPSGPIMAAAPTLLSAGRGNRGSRVSQMPAALVDRLDTAASAHQGVALGDGLASVTILRDVNALASTMAALAKHVEIPHPEDEEPICSPRSAVRVQFAQDSPRSRPSQDGQLPALLAQHHRELIRKLEVQDDVLSQILLKCVRDSREQKSGLQSPSRVSSQQTLDMERMSNHSDEAGWVMPLPTKVTSADLLPDEHDEDEPHHPTEHAFHKRPSVQFSERSSRLSFTPRSTFTPKLFTTFSQADLKLRESADHAQGINSRKRFASCKGTSLEHMKSPENCWQWLVGHPLFDWFFATVVLLNAVFIGVDVQMSIGSMEIRPMQIQVMQYCFTALFTIELALRFVANGVRLFCLEDWMWSLLDVFIVATSLWEIMVDIVTALEAVNGNMEKIAGISSLKVFRIIRITRIVKTIQLMRVFRFVMAFRTLISSIIHTLKALFWALILLLLIVYVFAVLFTQAVNAHIYDPEATSMSAANLEFSAKYFGSLPDTMLSLFMAIANGVSWEDILAPLRAISSAWVLLFLFYVAFTYFAVLNVVTGVFCQSAIDSAQNDHATLVQSMLANKEAHLHEIRALFSKLGASDSGVITYAMFEEKIDSPAVREYFETLGLDVWDAWSFFKLLDLDGGGSVEIEEFFKGCLRLRGQARAVDIGKIMHDQTWMIKSQGRFHTYMETELHFLKQEIAALRLGSSLTEQSPRTLLGGRSPQHKKMRSGAKSLAGGSAAGGSVASGSAVHSSASRATAASAASAGSQATDAAVPLARAPRRGRVDDEGVCTCDPRLFRPSPMPKCDCPNDDPQSLQDKDCKCAQKYLPAWVRRGKNCPCRKVFGAVYNAEVYKAIESRGGPLWERLEKDKANRENANAGVEALPVGKAVGPGPGASPGQPAAPATSSILSSVGTSVVAPTTTKASPASPDLPKASPPASSAPSTAGALSTSSPPITKTSPPSAAPVSSQPMQDSDPPAKASQPTGPASVPPTVRPETPQKEDSAAKASPPTGPPARPETPAQKAESPAKASPPAGPVPGTPPATPKTAPKADSPPKATLATPPTGTVPGPPAPATAKQSAPRPSQEADSPPKRPASAGAGLPAKAAAILSQASSPR